MENYLKLMLAEIIDSRFEHKYDITDLVLTTYTHGKLKFFAHLDNDHQEFDLNGKIFDDGQCFLRWNDEVDNFFIGSGWMR